MLGKYNTRIDFLEKRLKQVHIRIVRKDGRIKFWKNKYLVGKEFKGQRVEVMVVRYQLRAFLSSKKVIIFKLGDEDAVVVKLVR